MYVNLASLPKVIVMLIKLALIEMCKTYFHKDHIVY